MINVTIAKTMKKKLDVVTRLIFSEKIKKVKTTNSIRIHSLFKEK